MAVVLTLLYVFAAYVSPTTVYGSFAAYHLQVVIAIVILLFSLRRIPQVRLLRLPQTYAVLGLILAVAISTIVNGYGFGLALTALLDFVPTSIIFYFVVLNFRSKRSLQLLILTLFAAAAFTIVQGALAQHAGLGDSPWLVTMRNAQGQNFFRSRGMGFLNDPNDFAQFLAGLIPCMFFFWRQKSAFQNLCFVLLPVGFLLYGTFLTHSRGSMIALLVMTIVASRRRIGVLPAIVVGVVLFAGLTAAGFSGGREVSADSGSDRLDAWATGLQLIRSHPAFGVGFERFVEYNEITAHNTVVVCAAELGTFGLFFWLMLIASALRDVIFAARPLEPAETALAPASRGLRSPPASFAAKRLGSVSKHFSPAVRASSAINDPKSPSDAELRRLCSLMLVSCAGFLTAGWFLSRAYTMVIFLNIGLVTAVYRLTLERGIGKDPLSIGRAGQIAAVLSVVMIAIVYIILRVQHLMPH